MVDNEINYCTEENVKCYRIGNGQYAVFTKDKFGENLTVRIFDEYSGKYISAKGKITPEDYNNLYDNQHYALSINENNQIYVKYYGENPQTVDFTNSGTLYKTEINGKSITAIVVAGVAIGIIAGGAILYLSKNPPAAGSTAIGTGEIIGGEAAKTVITNIIEKTLVGGKLDVTIMAFLTTVGFNNKAEAIEALFQQAENTWPLKVAPILLDLNGDGVIDTTSIDNGVYFDHNNDGFAEKIAWVGANDRIPSFNKKLSVIPFAEPIAA